MAKSNTAAVIPSFAAEIKGMVSVLRTTTERMETLRAKQAQGVAKHFDHYLSRLTAAGIDKSQANWDRIRKEINGACKESAALQNILASGLYKQATLSHYTTALLLCWIHGEPFKPSAANTPAQGGLKRPLWIEQKTEKRDAAAGKGKGKADKAKAAPSKPVKVDKPALAARLTEDLGFVRGLYGDDAADALLDALMSVLPDFKVKA